MKFVVLNYGMDLDCWTDGREIGTMIQSLADEKPEKRDKILSTSLNSRWHDTFQINDEDWPHPNKILIELSKLDPAIQIDWMPELNYLGLYVESEITLDYLKDNFHHMMDAEAIQ